MHNNPKSDSYRIKIAIIDDDEYDYFLIKDYIKRIEGNNFIVDWCDDYDEALKKIKAKAYDLYFVDYRLGHRTGLELLQETSGMGCDDPIVLLTGKGNKSIDIQAMESGATDYLVKGELNTEKLERCIRYSLDRTASLKELKTRENKYRNLFESSKDAVFIADRGLSFKEMNNASSQLFGFNSEKLPETSLYDFIKDETQRKQITELLAKGYNINDLEIQVENLEKEIRSCLLSVAFHEHANGHSVLHGIVHDITNIKKTELANLQAQKLAANERFVRMLAHEIRNPLNNISLSIEYLQLQKEDYEKKAELLAIIQRNSIRINQIITELLNLTKPLELAFEKYSLQEIMDESLAIASDRINLQKIIVEKTYPDHPLEIAADKPKLIIAFTNILINAIEAMKINEGKLSVSITANENIYTVSIRDNGSGIPQEYLSKLFEPFFTMKKKGIGLGLAASYSIIQSHNAKIQVESMPDKGTNFIISISKYGTE
ncbi:MAG: ATP-binding protein [Bacteroidota bacterium]